MRAWCLFAVATLLSGCSFLVDSEQYVRKPGGDAAADASVDAPTGADGGVDAGDPCADVTCGPGMVCDPGTGECGAACDPICADDEVCAAGSCVACDADGDGFFAPGPRCAGLRGGAPPDCDDTLPEVHPGAQMVCGDGVVNACPGPRIQALLELVEAEVALVAPFQVTGAVPSAGRPELGLVYTDEGERGWVSFLAEAGPMLAHYDLDARAAELSAVGELGVELRDGYTPRGVYLGFAAGRAVLAVHSVASGSGAVGVFDFDLAAGGSSVLGDYDLNTFVPPLTVGLDRSGPAAIARSVPAGVPPAVVRMGTDGATMISSGEVAREPDWLAAAGELVIGPSTRESGVFVADVARPAVAIPIEGELTGAGDVILLSPEEPAYLAAVPTVEGIATVMLTCSGGFPLDATTCEPETRAFVGAGSLAVTSVSRAVDYNLVFAENVGDGGESEVAAFPIEADGAVIGVGGIALPLMTSDHLGFAPAVAYLESAQRFMVDRSLTVLAANVQSPATGSQELWISAVRVCATR